MTNNTRSNNWIKRLVIVGDFVLLNMVLYAFSHWHPGMTEWGVDRQHIFYVVLNFSLLTCEWHGHTIIHRRVVTSSDILKRVFRLTISHTLLSYIVLRALDFPTPVGYQLIVQEIVFLCILLLSRFIERYIVKSYRNSGGNTRNITFVGDDPELESVKELLMSNPALGYRIMAEYKDVTEFIRKLDEEKNLNLGDELYLCAAYHEKDTIKRISRLCDQQLVSFYYVPLSVECLGINLRREVLVDIDIYTTYEQPLQIPVNRYFKRFGDIITASVCLLPTALIFPIVWLIVKLQSHGPVFFRQQRTGLDGKTFTMYKFRSMHVNVAADQKQATKDDPRTFPFGSFMRKTSIDELPQLWNVLIGDMSIVGPRPHMLAHTEEYSHLIDKYMVRHFVKPGMTGWAQVSGFRGETKELSQMEERVKHDIWYMENWSAWLDIRIIWMTAKALLVHDEHAY